MGSEEQQKRAGNIPRRPKGIFCAGPVRKEADWGAEHVPGGIRAGSANETYDGAVKQQTEKRPSGGILRRPFYGKISGQYLLTHTKSQSALSDTAVRQG